MSIYIMTLNYAKKKTLLILEIMSGYYQNDHSVYTYKQT